MKKILIGLLVILGLSVGALAEGGTGHGGGGLAKACATCRR
jgi:hypothetical protein